MSEYRDNRPERTGTLRAGIKDLEIEARVSADHTQQVHTSMASANMEIARLVNALRTIENKAADVIKREQEMSDEDKRKFDAHMRETYGDLSRYGGGNWSDNLPA